MVQITVDGKVIEAPAGAPLVEVLKNNGFYVSSLCYIDGLKPYAGCRSCLVDIEGPPGLQLSCTAVVTENMVVRTNTPEVLEGRRSVLSIILANHSDRCLTCHRREHCHPGDICLRDDVVTHRCLTCSKNYRCELQATCEMVGSAGYEPWVGEQRTWYQTPQPPADRGNPFMEFDPQMCIICTRCVRACDEKRHTGAITLSGRGWDAMIAFGAGGPIHESNCDFSGACIDVCPTATLMEHPNKWVAKPEKWTSTTCDSCAVGCSIRLGSKDGRGVIVRPGDGNAFSGDQICVRGRYHYDSLKPRERLSKHLLRRGNIQAPATLAETAAEAARLLRETKSRGRIGVLVGGTVTNEEAFAIRELAQALGARPDQSLGPVVRAVKGALEERFGTWRMAANLERLPKAKAIVTVADDIEESHNVVSVRIKDAVVWEKAKLVVIGPLRSELVDFAAAWIRTAAGEEGVAAAQLAEALRGGTPANDEVARAAALLREAQPEATMVVCAPNPVSPAIAAAMTGGAANLAIALLGERASDGLAVLPPEANTWGLLDQGIGAEGGAKPLEGLAGLLVIRDDPTMRLPGAAAALEQIGTIVVVDGVAHPTAKRAQAVIAEGRAYASAGTYTAADFRVQKLAPAVRPEGDAVPLWEALHVLAKELGVELPATPDETLGQIAKANAAYEPAWDLIIGEGVKLPIGLAPRAEAAPVAAPTTAGDGWRVITSRDLYTAADAAALRHPEAEKLHRYDRIQVSEEDARALGIATGDPVRVSGNGVSIEAPAWVTERVPARHVYISCLLQGGAVTGLFDGADVATVRVEARVPAATA